MMKKFYRFTIIMLALAAVALGIAYLLTQPRASDPLPPQLSTPTPTPLPTFTPRPTSTPIVPPSQSELPGDKHYFYGDWEQAIAAYQSTLQNATSEGEKSQSLLGLGKTYYRQGAYNQSLDALRNLITAYPNSKYLPEAHFALAQTYSALDRDIEAAESYQAYLRIRPGVIDAYVQEERGDALSEAGQHIPAIEAYQAAMAASSVDGAAGLKLKIGERYLALQDYQSARVTFQEVYNQAANDYTKAKADYLLGKAYTALEKKDQAQAAYLDAVENYPLSYHSYLALVELVESGYPVNELDRGLVDYFAGQSNLAAGQYSLATSQYNLAINAFNRHLSYNETENLDITLYYKGFAFYKLGAIQYQSGNNKNANQKFQNALESWSILIDKYPSSDYWDEAWEFKAYTEWYYLGQYPQAVQTLLAFVDANPTHERAPEFLFDAARVYERTDELGQAAALWQRVYDDYPTSSYANQALFLAGIAKVRSETYADALSIFHTYQGASRSLEEEAQAHFWLGKTHQLSGNDEAAQAAWRQAANTDPTGYYSERARNLLQGKGAFHPPQAYDFGYDIVREQRIAEEWMRNTFSIPQETNLASLGPLAEDPHLVRGTELWQLDLYDKAKKEFEQLRKEVDFDPVSCYRLANYLRDLGLYRSAIYSARQVLNLTEMSDAETMNAPDYFNYIRFGTYYSELVIPASQAYDFHPLFIFSVIRQESLFEGFVRSSAGARGLMQIIPSTGADIAEKANWPPNYSPDDLYRPKVSVRFGTRYLNFQRNNFDGHIYAALAAYNAGYGNASVWMDDSGNDYDIFLETIRFKETRKYIKGITEIYSIYSRLYQHTP